MPEAISIILHTDGQTDKIAEGDNSNAYQVMFTYFCIHEGHDENMPGGRDAEYPGDDNRPDNKMLLFIEHTFMNVW